MTASDDSRAYERRQLADGWGRLPSVLLDPGSVEALDYLLEVTGDSKAKIIRRALVASADAARTARTKATLETPRYSSRRGRSGSTRPRRDPGTAP